MKTLYETIFDTTATPEEFTVRPGSKEELMQIIKDYIQKIKPHPGDEVDFNWIDISEVDDLSGLFKGTNYIPVIDTWKIDHVKNFARMFQDNKHIKSSPLPVLQRELSDSYKYLGCYEDMFRGCTSLVKAPALPAKKLKDYCYCGMFHGCTSLVEPPVLPARELAEDCYCGMFWYCTSLVKAPSLPARELVKGCCANMFRACTSLVKAPALPAKKLAGNCYRNLFWGCSSLKEKAKTPKGVVLSDFTALQMYQDCPNIKD